MKIINKFLIIGCIILLNSTTSLARTQDITLKCGDIFESEFTENEQTQAFLINMSAGDNLRVTGEPLGDQLKFNIFVFGPTNVHVANSDQGNSVDTGLLSANGLYTISTANFRRYFGERNIYVGQNNKGVGVYTLYIGCTFRDGTTINPGETPLQTGNISTTPLFSGIGFPGLPPVDFNNAVLIPFNASVPNSGGIAPGFDSVFGFTFDANAGDIFDMSVTRISGNLNLGVVILSADNKVVFYGGLITSESLSTRLTLPTAGQYTIGVFRVDLLPPDAPQATAFQVTGTLNP